MHRDTHFPMSAAGGLRRAGAAMVFLAAAACSPDALPTSASQPGAVAGRRELSAPVTTLAETVDGLANGLLACEQSNPYSASQTVGPAGGTIRIGPHALHIPVGALREPVTISAAVTPGSYVEIEFAPHGLQFARPAALAISYAGCGVLNGFTLQVVYVDDAHNVLERLPSLPLVAHRLVVAPVSHFSKYALADRSTSTAQ